MCRCIAIDDLLAVQMLGLALGLLYPTLQKIERAQRDNVDDCMMEMLAACNKTMSLGKVSHHGQC